MTKKQILAKDCKCCKKEFSRKKNSVYCSWQCSLDDRKNRKDIYNKVSKSRIADKNIMWKGNAVGYGALHRWVRKRKSRPLYCEECKETPPIDLANKGVYDRELFNWEWLCRKCHMQKDGRMRKLRQGLRSPILASTLKCCKCKNPAVAFWPVCDPDIPENPYCRNCLDEAKYRLFVEISNFKDNE